MRRVRYQIAIWYPSSWERGLRGERAGLRATGWGAVAEMRFWRASRRGSGFWRGVCRVAPRQKIGKVGAGERGATGRPRSLKVYNEFINKSVYRGFHRSISGLHSIFGARVPAFWGEGFAIWGEGFGILGRGEGRSTGATLFAIWRSGMCSVSLIRPEIAVLGSIWSEAWRAFGASFSIQAETN